MGRNALDFVFCLEGAPNCRLQYLNADNEIWLLIQTSSILALDVPHCSIKAFFSDMVLRGDTARDGGTDILNVFQANYRLTKIWKRCSCLVAYILQTDGYSVHDDISEQEKIILIHCMAHVRRYVVKALDSDKHRTEHVLDLIQHLYIIKRNCTEQRLDITTRKLVRPEQSEIILTLLGGWTRTEYQ